MNSDKIGSFIKKLRTDNKLSQYQLAEMIPISRQAVSKWERGETIPDSSTLLRLSEIFQVSINELLKGERLKTNTLKQLEKTTLDLVDDSNKKTKKIKKLLMSSITIIVLLILLFFTYYFINSYNSIKVYKLFAEGKNFDIYDGIMLRMRQKSYFRIGKIKAKNNHKINEVTLYYNSNKKKSIIINNDDDLEQIYYYHQGYSSSSKLNSILSNTYIIIDYDDNKKETIKLEFIRDYSNNNLLFLENFQRDKEEKEDNKDFLETNNKDRLIFNDETPLEELVKVETKEETIEDMMEKAIEKDNKSSTNTDNNEVTQDENAPKQEDDGETKLDLIKKLGIPNSGNYVYLTTVNNQEIRFVYYTMINQVMMYKDGIEEWNYLHNAKIYRCKDFSTKDSNQELCKKYVNESINLYVK